MIICIVGTNRLNSNSLCLAVELQRTYARLGRDMRLLDLTELPPEIFLPSAYAEKPASFEPFAQIVFDASGLVFVVGEYNGSFPGVLKLFIDHLPFPQSFEHRPVCFIGLAAGMWGGLRAVEHLQGVLGYRNAHLFPDRVLIPRCAAAFDAEGRLCDAELLARLERQAQGFLSGPFHK